jgi:hypothetical protein
VSPSLRSTGFKGDIKAIEDHVFDLIGGSKQAIKYDLTLDKICIYVGNEFDYGNDLVMCIKDNLTPASFPDPEDLAENASQAAQHRWKKSCDMVEVRSQHMADNVKRLYTVVWAQSSEGLKARLGESSEFPGIQQARDGLRLLGLVRAAMRDHQEKLAPCAAIYKARKMFIDYRQPERSSVSEYFDQFKSLLEVLDSLDAIPEASEKSIAHLERLAPSVPDADGVIPTRGRALMTRGRALMKKAAQDYEIAAAFLYNADQKRYGSLVKGLENSYQLGRHEYPRNLQAAYSLLSGWRPEYEHGAGPTEGLVCTTQGQGDDSKPGPKNKEHITCFTCHEKGHYANECPTKKAEGTANIHQGGQEAATTKPAAGQPQGTTESGAALTTMGVVLTAAASQAGIERDWILLDNQANVDIFVNADLLTNVRATSETLNLHERRGGYN